MSGIRPGLGLHLPDRDFYQPREVQMVLELNPTVLLTMLYEADKGAASQTNDLVAALGHEDVMSRTQIDRVVDLDAAWCADQALNRSRRLRAARVHSVTGNELNYVGEGFNGDLDGVMQWLRDFGSAAASNGLRQETVLHLPAPWTGRVGEDNEQGREYWRACKAWGLDELYDVADIHAYADGYGVYQDALEILGMAGWVSEHNRCMQAAAESTRLDAQPRVQAAIYFILTWENYNAMGTQREGDEFSLTWFPDLVDQFKAANESAAIIQGGSDVPEFVLGFKDKADELGHDVVGDPLEDQDYLPLATGGEIAFQTTSKGIMIYSRKANRAHFIPGR